MRVGNRLASLLLGLALLAVGLLAALAGALALAGRPPWPVRADRWYPALTTTPLRDPLVLAIAIAAAVVGVALLVAQLRWWPPLRLALAPDADVARDATGIASAGTTQVAAGSVPDEIAGKWWIARRSAERHLAAAVDAVSGVRDARVRLRGRTARWKVAVSARGRGEVRPDIEHAVRVELDRLTAPEPHRLRLSVRPPRRVA